MWYVVSALLFIAFQPGILFSFPPNGGLTTIVVHALFFAVSYQLLYTFFNEEKPTEGFQSTSPIQDIFNKIAADRQFVNTLSATDPLFTQKFTKLRPILFPPADNFEDGPKQVREGFQVGTSTYTYRKPSSLDRPGVSASSGAKRKKNWRSLIPEGVLDKGMDYLHTCFEPALQCHLNNAAYKAGADCTLGGDYSAPPRTAQSIQLVGNTGSPPLT
jgi:hypothetical protein